MKKYILILALAFIGCTPDEESIQDPNQSVPECWSLFAIGEDELGDFILIGKDQKDPRDRKRYSVKNYLDYFNKSKICDLKTIK